LEKVPVEVTEIVDGEEQTTTVIQEKVVKKMIKKPKLLDTKIVGYEMSEDGEVTPKIEKIFETKKVTKQRLKEGYEFDESDGKFYRKGGVTVTEKVVPGRNRSAMISILTKAVQQLVEKNDALEARIAALENAQSIKVGLNDQTWLLGSSNIVAVAN